MFFAALPQVELAFRNATCVFKYAMMKYVPNQLISPNGH
jgi:hypothetical protein